MSDPRIAQLRAKADSTTFPAEAKALRAKADELEAKEPKRPTRTFDPLAAAADARRRAEDRAASQAARERAGGTRRWTSADTEALRDALLRDQERARQARAKAASRSPYVDSARLMEAMAAAMRDADERIERARQASDGFRYASSDPNLRTDWTGLTFQKVTDINGNTYWTRVG